MSEGWLQVVRDALKLPSILNEVYGDLARPGVKQAGRALETVIGLGNTVLWPIAWANERSRLALEKNLEKYRKQLEAVPEERIVPVAPEVGVPIAEKLSYVIDESLSNLYVTLLTKASDKNTLDQAHPSFVNIINNLSPDEAVLLEKFRVQKDVPCMAAKAIVKTNTVFTPLHNFLLPEGFNRGLVFPHNLPAYFSNLAGLGIVEIHTDQWLEATDEYEKIKGVWTSKFEEAIEQTENLRGRKLEFSKGVISVTPFGMKFIEACHAS